MYYLVLPSEEGFAQAETQGKISKEIVRYLKQQNLSTGPLLPAMQEVQESIDDVLSRSDLSNDVKAERYFRLQDRYLSHSNNSWMGQQFDIHMQ